MKQRLNLWSLKELNSVNFILFSTLLVIFTLKKNKYLVCIMIFLVFSVQVMDREALGISNIVRKVLMFNPPALLVSLDQDILQGFLQQLTHLTCSFADGAAVEESVSDAEFTLLLSILYCQLNYTCNRMVWAIVLWCQLFLGLKTSKLLYIFVITKIYYKNNFYFRVI